MLSSGHYTPSSYVTNKEVKLRGTFLKPSVIRTREWPPSCQGFCNSPGYPLRKGKQTGTRQALPPHGARCCRLIAQHGVGRTPSSRVGSGWWLQVLDDSTLRPGIVGEELLRRGRGPRVPRKQGRPEGPRREVRWSEKGVSLDFREFIF